MEEKHGFTAKVHASALGEGLGAVREKEEAAAAVWKRSAAAEEVLRYDAYVYLKYLNSALPNCFLSREHTNLVKLVMFEFRSPKPPTLFETLPGSAASALVIVKPKSPTGADLVPDKQVLVMKNRLYLETALSLHTKRRRTVSALIPFLSRDSSRIDIAVPLARIPY